jgi:eukaryotic-like serine/threonine-protein kinase
VQTHPETVYRFGPFEVKVASAELLKNGRRIRLQEQPYRLLLVLLENSGEIVSREKLRSHLWPGDTFVDFDGSLRAAVRKLREALCDDAEAPRYIETIPKRGYRFLMPEVRRMDAATPEGAERNGHLAHLQTEASRVVFSPRHDLVLKYGTIAVAMLILTAAGVFLWQHRKQATPLTDKDVLVLADFANTTGDPVFDGTLRQGLSIQLEQSPFLSIASEGRVQQTLKMMDKPIDTKLTPAIARELCQRAGYKAVLDGSIAQIGTQYLLSVRAVVCSTGDTLASVEAQARDKNHVLDALGKTALEMRNKLGESLRTVQKFDTPLEQATTSSLEALKAYSLGREATSGSKWATAAPFYQRAISLDPNFAMAHARLGTSYRMLSQPTLASENTRKAYELREHVSELEKFYIESHYYQQATGELDKARQVYELWAQSYPRDWARASGETAVSSLQGQYEEGLIESREELRLHPNGDGYYDLIYFYLSLNRLTEAQSMVEEAHAKNFDSPSIRALVYKLRFLQKDATGMSQQVAWATGKPEAETRFLGLEADTAAYSGRLGLARDLSRRAVVSAKQAGAIEVASGYEASVAVTEALFGNLTEARRRASDAIELSNGWYTQSLAALALASAGDAVRSGTLADDLGIRFPVHTVVQSYYLPTIHAQLALSRNDPSGAIEVLHATAPYELSALGQLYPTYVRGESYLAAHEGDKAAAEFQKILDHSGLVANAPIGAVAHLGLGRAYALSGESSKAKIAYQDFLTLWKDADPDIPILICAKKEYAALR